MADNQEILRVLLQQLFRGQVRVRPIGSRDVLQNTDYWVGSHPSLEEQPNECNPKHVFPAEKPPFFPQFTRPNGCLQTIQTVPFIFSLEEIVQVNRSDSHQPLADVGAINLWYYFH